MLGINMMTRRVSSPFVYFRKDYDKREKARIETIEQQVKSYFKNLVSWT